MGFNKGDSYIGHWLGLELRLGLTPGQWKLAISTCRKYHGQVGECPSDDRAVAPQEQASHG